MLRKVIQVFAYSYYFSLTSQPNRAYSRLTIRDEAITYAQKFTIYVMLECFCAPQVAHTDKISCCMIHPLECSAT